MELASKEEMCMEDWRLQGQERYLKGLTLTWRTYRVPNAGWDHDHCEFCWAKFMMNGTRDSLKEGYVTLDSQHWICKDCYEDFCGIFEWQVVKT